MAKKKSFILYADYIKHIRRLPDEEAGRLFKAIFDYVNEGKLPDLDGMAAMAFSFIANQLDTDLQKYETVCKKRAESAKRRWQKNDDAEGIDKVVGEECKSMQMHTNAVTCINLHSDSDIDSDIDIENEIDIDSDSDSGSVLHNMRPRGAHHTIHLTEQDYKNLCEKYGQAIIDQYIERIDQYLSTNNKKPYPNHYQTILKWLESDNVKPSSSPSYDVDAIFQHALTTTPTVKRKE